MPQVYNFGMPVTSPPFDLSTAIQRVQAYADIFDCPLTEPQLRRYLEINLDGDLPPNSLPTNISQSEQVPPTVKTVWQQAQRYTRLLRHFPGIRMIAVTGSLAMNNIADDADIDLLIVTQPNRLWLTRMLVIGIVYLARWRGISLCPNFFMSEDTLATQQKNLYVAREIAQMTPLFGQQVYANLRNANTWVTDYLPNAVGAPHFTQEWQVTDTAHWSKAIFERLLSGQLGNWIESWEMQRKIQKFRPAQQCAEESNFSATRCKGHFDMHQQRIMEQFTDRLNTMERHP